MFQGLPHFATISYAFRHRFTDEAIEKVFRWILEEIEHAGYLSKKTVFVDGTHIQANVNLRKHAKTFIPQTMKVYQEQLLDEVSAGHAAHGKKPLRKDYDYDNLKPPEEKMIIESTTDPESGVFHKGERKKYFAYEAHAMCERYGCWR